MRKIIGKMVAVLVFTSPALGNATAQLQIQGKVTDVPAQELKLEGNEVCALFSTRSGYYPLYQADIEFFDISISGVANAEGQQAGIEVRVRDTAGLKALANGEVVQISDDGPDNINKVILSLPQSSTSGRPLKQNAFHATPKNCPVQIQLVNGIVSGTITDCQLYSTDWRRLTTKRLGNGEPTYKISGTFQCQEAEKSLLKQNYKQ